MIDSKILAEAEKMNISGRLNHFSRISQIKKEPPGYLRKKIYTDEMTILGNGDLNDYYNQPLIIIPLNDFFKMVQSMHPNKLFKQNLEARVKKREQLTR